MVLLKYPKLVYLKKEKIMTKIIKTVSFSENDTLLVKRIKKYQAAKGLNSFVSAVRELCDDALTLKEIVK